MIEKFGIHTGVNLISRFWTMLSAFIFVPIYISLLGVESYSLITFFVTMQIILSLLGVGLSKTLRKEFASNDNSEEENNRKFKLLKSIELIYFFILLIILGISFFSSNYIAERWLNIETLDIPVVSTAIKLMGTSIALQLLANLYIGCLFGLDFQIRANIYQVIWSAAKNIGVILVLIYIYPNIISFYTWHLFIDVFYIIIIRRYVIKHLRKNSVIKWRINDLVILKTIWKYSLGLLIISFGFTINTQVDKMVISNLLSLTALGAYSTTFILANITSIIPTAIGNTIFTKFAYLSSVNNVNEQKKLFLKVNKISSIFIVSTMSFTSIFAYEILIVWTGSYEIANLMKNSAFFLVFGFSLNSIQLIAYEYLLANGKTKLNNIQTFVSIPYVLIVTPILVSFYGLMGASISVFTLMTLSTIVYLFAFNKYFLKEKPVWIINDVFLPLTLALLLAVLTKAFLNYYSIEPQYTLIIAISMGLITLLILFCIFDFASMKRLVYWIKEKRLSNKRVI